MKTKFLLPLAAAALIGICGCKTSVNSVENAQKSSPRNMVSDSRAITDNGLKKKVDIVGVNTAMTPGGLLKVQVELLNHTRAAQQFDYRFEWFDGSGMQVGGIDSAVIASEIEGGEDKFISAIAPNPNCKDFRVKFYRND